MSQRTFGLLARLRGAGSKWMEVGCERNAANGGYEQLSIYPGLEGDWCSLQRVLSGAGERIHFVKGIS
jgi:hypothetical protein